MLRVAVPPKIRTAVSQSLIRHVVRTSPSILQWTNASGSDSGRPEPILEAFLSSTARSAVRDSERLFEEHPDDDKEALDAKDDSDVPRAAFAAWSSVQLKAMMTPKTKSDSSGKSESKGDVKLLSSADSSSSQTVLVLVATTSATLVLEISKDGCVADLKKALLDIHSTLNPNCASFERARVVVAADVVAVMVKHGERVLRDDFVLGTLKEDEVFLTAQTGELKGGLDPVTLCFLVSCSWLLGCLTFAVQIAVAVVVFSVLVLAWKAHKRRRRRALLRDVPERKELIQAVRDVQFCSLAEVFAVARLPSC